MKSLKQILGDAVSEGIQSGVAAGPRPQYSDYPTDERATRVIRPPAIQQTPASIV